MFCRNCGELVHQGDNFCVHCGHPLELKNKPEETEEKTVSEVEKSDQDSLSSVEKEISDGKDYWNREKREAFSWNVHNFPSNTKKPTEDIDFNWNVEEEPKEAPKTEDAVEETPEEDSEKVSVNQGEDQQSEAFSREAAEEETVKEESLPTVEEEHPEEVLPKSQDTRETESSEVTKEPETETVKEEIATEPETEKEDKQEKKVFGSFFKKWRTKKVDTDEESSVSKDESPEEKESIPVIAGAPKLQKVVGPKMAGTMEEKEQEKEMPLPLRAEEEPPVSSEEVQEISSGKESLSGSPNMVVAVGPRMMGKSSESREEIKEEPEEEVPVFPKEETEAQTQEESLSGSPKMVAAVGPSMMGKSSESEEEPQEKPSEQPTESESESSQETADSIQDTDQDTEAGRGQEIDEFYISNERNAEFQKLLDRECEKLQRAAEEKQEKIVDRRGDEEEIRALLGEEGLSQREEMERARKLLFQNELEQESQEAQVAGGSDQSDTSKEIAEKKKQTSTESDKGVAEKDDTEEKTKSKKKKGGDVVIAIVAILLIIVLALVAIRFVAPDSIIGQKTEIVTNKIVHLLGGDSQQEATGQEQGETKPFDPDITGAIQLELDQNLDNAIGTIRYNKTVAYDGEQDYGVEDINNSREIEENLWYVDENDKKYDLDRAIVGAVIGYESQLALDNAPEQIVETLDIGDIRMGQDCYYVWINVYQKNADGQSLTKKNVLKIAETDRMMNVVDVYPL